MINETWEEKKLRNLKITSKPCNRKKRRKIGKGRFAYSKFNCFIKHDQCIQLINLRTFYD